MTKSVKFSWIEGKAEGFYNGAHYSWLASDTPGVFVEGEGWKPLTWASYHGKQSIAAQRKIIRETVREIENNN